MFRYMGAGGLWSPIFGQDLIGPNALIEFFDNEIQFPLFMSYLEVLFII